MKPHRSLWLLGCAICLATACKKEVDQSVKPVTGEQKSSVINELGINPALFVEGIDNPYFPLVPGTVFHYINFITDEGELSTENNIVTVTSDIKKILGVNCEVVHDVIKEGGEITEDTYDWYAQDIFGNVWYFGEDTKALTDTGWSTEGSWEAGVDGARPGIIMFGKPGLFVGHTYYQEFSPGVAEDQATLINLNSTVIVPFGHFTNCLKTKEFTNLEPGHFEYKFYAEGIGQVLGRSENERDELISVKHQ